MTKVVSENQPPSTQAEFCLGEALDAHSSLGRCCGDIGRMRWLDSQLTHMISQIKGIILDIESGLSVHDMGYTSDEFSEMMQDIECQIRTLKALIRGMEVGRTGR